MIQLVHLYIYFDFEKNVATIDNPGHLFAKSELESQQGGHIEVIFN